MTMFLCSRFRWSTVLPPHSGMHYAAHHKTAQAAYVSDDSSVDLSDVGSATTCHAQHRGSTTPEYAVAQMAWSGATQKFLVHQSALRCPRRGRQGYQYQRDEV